MAAAYPPQPTPERRKSFEQFLTGFAENFPCSVCGVHLKQHLEQFPIADATENIETLQKYIYDLHESVNKRKGKPQMHSLEDVKAAFDITKPWESFGGYPIIPSHGSIKGADKPSVMLKEDSKNSGTEKIFLTVIIILALILFVTGAVAIYFFVRCKNLKETSNKKE